MIKSFADAEAELIFNGIRSKKLPVEIQNVARRKLRMIDNAEILDDLRIPPGNRLELLQGNLKGYSSIRINDQWRIKFKWSEGGAYKLAKEINIPQTRVSDIIHGKRRITADTALRLARFFGTSANFWLGLQNAYDIEEEELKQSSELEKIHQFQYA